MWVGVTKGLAERKFSGSPILQGAKNTAKKKKSMNTKVPKRSFTKNRGKRVSFSRLELRPRGLLEPVSWRKIIWTIANTVIIKGNKKWNAKKRLRVGLLTDKPPHSQMTKSVPISGIAENRFVITEAPQKDIWPHGSTYPRNAEAMARIRILTPTAQTGRSIKLPKYSPRMTWR